MKTILTVVSPFGGHAQGDRIDAPADVAAILASEYAQCVIPSQVPDEPAPAPARAASKRAADAAAETAA